MQLVKKCANKIGLTFKNLGRYAIYPFTKLVILFATLYNNNKNPIGSNRLLIAGITAITPFVTLIATAVACFTLPTAVLAMAAVVLITLPTFLIAALIDTGAALLTALGIGKKEVALQTAVVQEKGKESVPSLAPPKRPLPTPNTNTNGVVHKTLATAAAPAGELSLATAAAAPQPETETNKTPRKPLPETPATAPTSGEPLQSLAGQPSTPSSPSGPSTSTTPNRFRYA